MRSLFIDAELSPANLQQCCVLAVTPLLRELIVRAVQGPQHAENPLIQQLMLQELASLENLPLHIPMPEDRRCRTSVWHCCKNLITSTRWRTGRSRSAPVHARWHDCFSNSSR
jgi:hypothetical protein